MLRSKRFLICEDISSSFSGCRVSAFNEYSLNKSSKIYPVTKLPPSGRYQQLNYPC